MERSIPDVIQKNTRSGDTCSANLPRFRVLVFNLLQTPHFGRRQAALLPLPVEIGCLADSGPLTDPFHWYAVRPPFQIESLWAFETLRCLRCLLLLFSSGNITEKL